MAPYGTQGFAPTLSEMQELTTGSLVSVGIVHASSGIPDREAFTSHNVNLTDRSGQTGAVRYWYTGPVWPETSRYQWNSNLNSNFAIQPVRTGIPAGLAGIPAGLAGIPVI